MPQVAVALLRQPLLGEEPHRHAAANQRDFLQRLQSASDRVPRRDLPDLWWAVQTRRPSQIAQHLLHHPVEAEGPIPAQPRGAVSLQQRYARL